MAPSNLTAEEAAVAADFRATIGKTFQNIYGDQWDEDLWQRAKTEFEARHPSHLVQTTMLKMAGWDSWNQCRDQFREGPPVFMRDGWVSPLIGQQLDLSLLDDDSLESIQGDLHGWRHAKVLIIEFWATWCKPCLRVFPHLSDLAEKHSGRVSVIGINVENVFGESPDVDVRAFVANQTNLKYIVAVDIAGRAQELIYQPAGRLSVPTALLITPSDRRVHFVGHPNKIPDEMLDALLM